MCFILREGVSFCETSGRLVFLDMVRDRYFCLEKEAESVIRRLVCRQPLSTEDENILTDLLDDHLLVAGPDRSQPHACLPPPLPERSLADEDLPVGSVALGHALWHLVRSSIELKARPLRAVVSAIGRRKAQLGHETDAFAALAEIAGASRRSALIAAPLDRCLPRSFATAHAMLDRTLRPDLVFGVRLHPFGAHCWVQHGRILVNETLDQARNFTPILVV